MFPPSVAMLCFILHSATLFVAMPSSITYMSSKIATENNITPTATSAAAVGTILLASGYTSLGGFVLPSLGVSSSTSSYASSSIAVLCNTTFTCTSITVASSITPTTYFSNIATSSGDGSTPVALNTLIISSFTSINTSNIASTTSLLYTSVSSLASVYNQVTFTSMKTTPQQYASPSSMEPTVSLAPSTSVAVITSAVTVGVVVTTVAGCVFVLIITLRRKKTRGSVQSAKEVQTACSMHTLDTQKPSLETDSSKQMQNQIVPLQKKSRSQSQPELHVIDQSDEPIEPVSFYDVPRSLGRCETALTEQALSWLPGNVSTLPAVLVDPAVNDPYSLYDKPRRAQRSNEPFSLAFDDGRKTWEKKLSLEKVAYTADRDMSQNGAESIYHVPKTRHCNSYSQSRDQAVDSSREIARSLYDIPRRLVMERDAVSNTQSHETDARQLKAVTRPLAKPKP